MGTLSVVAKNWSDCFDILFLKKNLTVTETKKIPISVTIPNGVTVVEDGAFSCCDNLENVTMPSSVKVVGESAFDRCKNLKNITIPYGVKSIGEYAFSSCDNLENVTIPNSVISIGESAFDGCKSLESITIPDGVTSIGKDVFSVCENLKSVTIPDSVISIGESAFSCCDNLENVTIPNSVTSIGKCAFSCCESLEIVTLPDSVTSIGDEAFRGCESLESVTIPGGVTNVGKRAFCECKNLKHVTILKGVTTISEEAFCNCNNLESVTIPDSVKSIEKCAFEYCSSLKSVIIPCSVTFIDSRSFDRYEGLERIIGISGSYAEKWAEENCVEFEAQTSISNKIQKEEPDPRPSMTLKEKSFIPKKAGENAESMLNQFSELDNIVSVSQSQKLIPFQESMKIGTHHITEGVQRIEVMNMWSVDIPKGYEFSLDSEYTGKSIGGENRPLVIMIDNEYSDFLYPYQSEINFVVFATRQVDFKGQPLNSLNSRGIIIQMNESIRRSTKNYKSIVETELISVQYVTVEHRKNESEFNISIFTQDTWFLAQFLFNEPALGKDGRVKMVEEWMQTIKPLQKKRVKRL